MFLASLWTVSTAAQDTDSDVESLDTIIIFGRGWDDGKDGRFPQTASAGMKSETQLVEIPQSVSVVTETQINESGASTIGQALVYSPGVFANPSGGNDSTRYDFHSLRGQSYNGALLLDGMRATFGVGNLSLPQFDPFNLERIEVIRGPSSGLYGQGLPGGIVNAVTKRPTGEAHRELSVSLGSYDRREVAFDLGDSSGNGMIDFRLAGLVRSADNAIDHVSEERRAIAPTLRWHLSDRTTLTVFSSYQEDPEGGYYNALPPDGVLTALPDGRFIPRDFYVGDPNFDRFERQQIVLGYSINHEFGNGWQLRQELRSIDSQADVQALTTTALVPPSELARSALFGDSHTDALLVDTAINGVVATGSATHRLLLGFDYMKSAIDQQLGLDLLSVPPIDIWNPAYGGAFVSPDSPTTASIWSDTLDEATQLGVYAQDQIVLNRVILTLNARYDSAETDSARTSALFGGDTSGASDHPDDAFSGRAALLYQFDEDFVGYASYASAFLPQTGLDAQGDGFVPLEAGQWELGVKYAPADRSLWVSAAVFDISQKNVLTPYPNPDSVCIGLAGPGPCRVQTGEQRTRGLELEAKGQLTENTYLHTSVTVLDAEITQSNGPDLEQRPVNIPDTTASIWLGHTLNTAVNVGLGARHVGDLYADPANTIKVPSHSLIDAAVSYDFSRHIPGDAKAAVTLRATNLGDRRFVSCSALTYCNYGEGRKLSAELSFAW